jgi:hypothetical protein
MNIQAFLMNDEGNVERWEGGGRLYLYMWPPGAPRSLGHTTEERRELPAQSFKYLQLYHPSNNVPQQFISVTIVTESGPRRQMVV